MLIRAIVAKPRRAISQTNAEWVYTFIACSWGQGEFILEIIVFEKCILHKAKLFPLKLPVKALF